MATKTKASKSQTKAKTKAKGKAEKDGLSFRDRIVDFRRVPASELVPNPHNWRKHPKEQLEAIKAVLGEVGFAGAELCRLLPDGRLMLIDGHARAEVAGDQEVPVLVLDVTELEAKKLLATYDPIGQMAGRDAEQLSNLFKDLQAASDTLAALVFPEHEMDPLMSADWSPPAEGPMPGHETTKFKVVFTEAQWKCVQKAIARQRKQPRCGDLSDSQCVEAICKKFAK